MRGTGRGTDGGCRTIPECSMNGSSVRLAFFIMLTGAVFMAHAEYWFQFGARAGISADQNTGAGVTLQTIDQHIGIGSLAYWVGEDMPDGSFLQIGYLIENQTANYPALCDATSCRNYELLNAGSPEWFYEYFPPGNNDSFMGAIGPDGSAGRNGTFHRYYFYYSNGRYYFNFDGNNIGSTSIGNPNSGPNAPVAFGELANASTNSQQLSDVAFKNFSVFQDGQYLSVPEASAYIGYGVGSLQTLKNSYGVGEVGNLANYFRVGSGLAQPMNGVLLWKSAFELNIKSPFGNLSSQQQYIGNSQINLSAQRIVNITSSARELFAGWMGEGLGSYTGTQNPKSIILQSNITETVEWQTQYLLSLLSQYGSVSGSGWYDSGAGGTYSVNESVVYLNSTAREIFTGWSNGNKNSSGSVIISQPEILRALWQREYYVNATSDYYNASGSGWYANGTYANLSVAGTLYNVSVSERYAFKGWSNGNTSRSIRILINGPSRIKTVFKKQDMMELVGEDHYGDRINVSGFSVDHTFIASRIFLDENSTATISNATYKGAIMPVNFSFRITSPSVVPIELPVYDIYVKTSDYFGLPVNAFVDLRFLNGTANGFYTGNSGNLSLRDIPYGYVNGTASYLLSSANVLAEKGSGVTLRFISIYNIFGVILIIILLAMLYIGLSKRGKGRNN